MAGIGWLTRRRNLGRRHLRWSYDDPEDWQPVSAPDAVFSFVPFAIEQTGRRFQPAAGWNLQVHAGITVAKTYFVDRGTGNDGAAGTTWGTALKTLTAACAKADVDRVYIRNGFYYRSESLVGTRSVEVIGDGTAVLSNDMGNMITSAVKVGNHWEIVFSGYTYMSMVRDEMYQNAFEVGSLLTNLGSVGAVDAAPGSWWYNYTGAANNTLYIRLADDRTPDALIRYQDTGPLNVTSDNRRLYLEGLVFYGGGVLQNASASGGLRAYLRNCVFWPGALTVRGLTEIICQNVRMMANGDGINYDARNGVINRAIEIGCDIQNSMGGTTEQASTAHTGCITVRLGGNYHNVSGQCVADVTASQAWLLGCVAFDSRVGGVGFYLGGAGGRMWLDQCTTRAAMATYDLQNEVGAATYTRGFMGSRGVNQIGGSMGTY